MFFWANKVDVRLREFLSKRIASGYGRHKIYGFDCKEAIVTIR